MTQRVFETVTRTYTRQNDSPREGACAFVYRTTDEYGNEYAIKLLKENIASAEKIGRFKSELSFCAQNRHPNILTVMDHGENENGQPFYVMPLYPGSLRDVIKRGIPHDEVLPMFSKIIDGVECAHLLGVVHRDLKPENILCDPNSDRLVVADFGIAYFKEDSLFKMVETKTGTRLANFKYAAPEQRMPVGRVDHRADIYALGLILNEMFTGETPLGTDFKNIDSVSQQYKYLDSIVEQMIRQSPDDRFGSLDEVKQSLMGGMNSFIIRQKLDQLSGNVVPYFELNDPLLLNPPEIVKIEAEVNLLHLGLNRPVNAAWINGLHNLESDRYSSHVPKDAEINHNQISIACSIYDAPSVVTLVNEWVSAANTAYREKADSKSLEQKEERDM